MSDLIKRLRELPTSNNKLRDEAADEIERLRAALKAIARPKSGFGYSEDLRKVALAALEGDDE